MTANSSLLNTAQLIGKKCSPSTWLPYTYARNPRSWRAPIRNAPAALPTIVEQDAGPIDSFEFLATVPVISFDTPAQA